MSVINEDEGTNVVTRAVLKIINEFFEKDSSDLSFTYSANDGNSLYIMLQSIQDILIKLNSKFLISLEHETNMARNNFSKYHNIIFVEDCKSFLKVFNGTTPNMYDYQGYYIIVLTNYNEIEIKKIFEVLWSFYVVNVNIISKDPEHSDEAKMFTYFPFTEDYCEKVEVLLWNNYTIEAGFKNKKTHFPNKMANLHGCPLKLATVLIPPFVILEKPVVPFGPQLFGLDGLIMHALQKRMNFTLEVTVVRNNSYLWGQLFENGTSTGAIEMIMTGKVNLTIGYYTSSPLRNLKMSGSITYYTSNLVWIVPPSRQITSIEKLMKPFSPTLWSAVIIVFIISFLIISLIGCFSITIQNFVFGRNIRTPSLNVINVFFGGSLVNTPTRNFARTLLCFFMLYCLIIRSSYQGALIQYMQMDSRTPVVASIDEMVRSGYKFYFFKNNYEHVSRLKKVMKRLIFVERETLPLIWADLLIPEFKGALLSSQDHVAYWNKNGFPVKFYTTCKAPLKTINLCIYMKKHSCLTAEINRHILRYNANGLIKIWASQYIDHAYLKERVDDREPQKLQFHQLLGGFQMYAVGIIIGFGVLILEILIKWITKLFAKYSNRF
ncbi:unnamed protein product [Diamesa serratosioi]